MKIDFTPADRGRLLKIFINCPALTTASDRRAVLVNAHLDELIAQMDQEDGKPYTENTLLFEFLVRYGRTREGSQAIGSFCNALIPLVGEDDRTFLRKMIDGHKLMCQRIDGDFIFGFNMESLESAIRSTVGYEGFYGFFLRNCNGTVRPHYCRRIEMEIINKTRRKPNSFDPIAARDPLEERIKEACKVKDMEDLFIGSKLDLLLFINNFKYGTEAFYDIASAFWQSVKSNYAGYIKDKSRNFILVCIDHCSIGQVSSYTLPNNLVCIDPDRKIVIEQLKSYVRGYLRIRGIAPGQIDEYCERLECFGGELAQTYSELEMILRELNGGIVDNG